MNSATLKRKSDCAGLQCSLTGDLGVVVHVVLLPLLGSHVVVQGEQQVLFVETILLLLGFAEAGKEKKQPHIFH